MTELVTTRIQASATKLGLPHLAKTLTEFTSRADAGSMGYLDFLDLVLQEELAVRDERRFRTGLRLSRLPINGPSYRLKNRLTAIENVA